jgi:hypothetical protein
MDRCFPSKRGEPFREGIESRLYCSDSKADPSFVLKKTVGTDNSQYESANSG